MLHFEREIKGINREITIYIQTKHLASLKLADYTRMKTTFVIAYHKTVKDLRISRTFPNRLVTVALEYSPENRTLSVIPCKCTTPSIVFLATCKVASNCPLAY